MSAAAQFLGGKAGATRSGLNFVGADEPVHIVGRQESIHTDTLCARAHISQEITHTSSTDLINGIVVSVDPKRIIQTLIRQILEVSGLTLTRLARKANLAPSTLTKFMNDQTDDMPSTRTLVKLTETTGLKLSVLPTGPEARPDSEMLRLAMRVALRHVPEDEPEREAELARIGVLTYEVLAESKEQGRPITDDAAAVALVESVVRRFLSRR